MVKNNKKPNYEEYFNILIPVPLNSISNEDFILFKKTKGKGQFLATFTLNGETISERWEFYKEDGMNFNKLTKDSKIKCLPVCVDRENNLIDILYDHIGKIHLEYKSLEDAKINIIHDDNSFNQSKVVNSTKPGNLNLKIGLYLQTKSFKKISEFDKSMKTIHNEDFDILVFPEYCFTPFTVNIKSKNIFDLENQQEIIDYCLELSKSIDKAVIVSSDDANKVIFSVYANAKALDNETVSRIYIKHTMTDNSPFIDDDYENHIQSLFTPIILKGYSIGLTICYDCNHAPFSRMYGLQNVDVIINSTGGDVVYDKWYKYNKARAIENQCYNFVTMGGNDETKNNNITYGFNPEGGLILPVNIDKDKPTKPGKVYIYDLSSCCLDSTPEKSIDQEHTLNKIQSFEMPVGKSAVFLNNCKKIKENIYVHPVGKFNVFFLIVEGNDILKPEKVLPLLYDNDLIKYENKKYIIINRHKNIDKKFYSEKLSIILKVRTIENFSVVILESNDMNMCYQSSDSKTVQVVKAENDMYGIDLDRAGGPESIWKNKRGTRKNWRENFEKLIKYMAEIQ